ncbi:MAG: hypothetical protein J0L66_06155 [Cytophagales bacterium]|nr:hypothetical protein [Cytophagales bacterium]
MKIIYGLFLVGLVLGCSTEKKEPVVAPEAGFNLALSDPAAIQLADSVMQALGGRSNWDKIRFITWKSQDGLTTYYWDKSKRRARMEDGINNSVTLINLANGTTRVAVNGSENPANAAAANAAFSRALYSLALPFLTKSQNFSLLYMGEDTLARQRYNSLVLVPKDSAEGRYKLFVDKTAKLVRYWSYYPAAAAPAEFILPFDNYEKQSDILFSGNRSAGQGPTSIKVEAELADKLFTEF